MLLRLLLVAAIVVTMALVGAWWQRRDGQVVSSDGRFRADHLDAVGLVGLDGVGGALLLGSPTCAPCVTVKQILTEVVDERPDFRWVYADAADHLDIADAHHVMRVPTLFVLDHGGRILARTSGVPAKRDLLRVLDREGELDPAA